MFVKKLLLLSVMSLAFVQPSYASHLKEDYETREIRKFNKKLQGSRDLYEKKPTDKNLKRFVDRLLDDRNINSGKKQDEIFTLQDLDVLQISGSAGNHKAYFILGDHLLKMINSLPEKESLKTKLNYIVEAKKYLEIAALNKYPAACLRLGYLYMENEDLGLPNDLRSLLTINYFINCVHLSEFEGYLGLGKLYSKGKIVQKDEARATFYFNVALQKGLLNALSYLQKPGEPVYSFEEIKIQQLQQMINQEVSYIRKLKQNSIVGPISRISDPRPINELVEDINADPKQENKTEPNTKSKRKRKKNKKKAILQTEQKENVQTIVQEEEIASPVSVTENLEAELTNAALTPEVLPVAIVTEEEQEGSLQAEQILNREPEKKVEDIIENQNISSPISDLQPSTNERRDPVRFTNWLKDLSSVSERQLVKAATYKN